MFLFVHVYVCGLFIDSFVSENVFLPVRLLGLVYIVVWLFSLLGLMLGFSLVVGSNLGGDNLFYALMLFLVIGYAGSFVYQFLLFGINGGVLCFLFLSLPLREGSGLC